MKKRIFTAALGFALLLFSATTAFAERNSAQWDVTFTSGNTLDSNYTLAEVSRRVYEMQPGDTVDLTLHLQNQNPSAANWYMTNKVLQSLEESGRAASGGAYEYELTYTNPANSQETIYASDVVGGERTGRFAQDRVGLKGATEALEDYFYLDTLQPGQQATVNLRVSLDGETQGNSYQATLAKLQLNFAVDTTTADVTTTTTRTANELTAVQTGDTNKAMPFAIAAAISGFLLLYLSIVGRRERRRLERAAKRMLCLALVGLFACAMPAGLGLAVQAEEPTYTVRLYPGAQGSIGSGSLDAGLVTVVGGGGQYGCRVRDDGVCELSGLPYGAVVTFNPQRGVSLANESKYYVRGVRVSGQDNSTVDAPAFEVTTDLDYVVAYGIRGEMVDYTIRYVDENGTQLAEPTTLHGNIGDSPVVAYQYIEGYQPNAYNLTRTLSDNAAENVFTFVYTPAQAGTVTQTVLSAAPGVVTVVEGGGAGGAGGAGGGTGAGTENLTPPDTPLGPQNTLDLNPDLTPLGGLADGISRLGTLTGEFATSIASLPRPLKLFLSVFTVGLGLLLILLFARKKREPDDNVDVF